jgi:anti-sigma factor RsiW
MNPDRHTDLPPEWLAAYADGELCPRERACVEHWLAEHPEARELLEAQEALSRSNVEFWESVRPPAPCPAAWARAVRGVADRTPATPRRLSVGWLGTIGLMATAATLLLALPAVDRPPGQRPPPPAAAPDPGVDDAPYAMARDEDVRIVSLPEDAAGQIIVGAHPLGNSMVVLAGRDDLVVQNMGADPAGRIAEMFDDQDGAVVWAPKDE